MNNEDAEELFVRFFINAVPITMSTETDFALIAEESYYFYLTMKTAEINHYNEINYKFKRFLNDFFSKLDVFKQLIPRIRNIESALNKIKKKAIPCGCICYNKEFTHVLVVHHAICPTDFSFPKGKMMEGETEMMAAARETLEETGIDISPYISNEHKFIYNRGNGRSSTTMFHVCGVPYDKILVSPSPLEIHKVRWIKLTQIGKEPNYHPDNPTKAILETAVKEFLTKMGKTINF